MMHGATYPCVIYGNAKGGNPVCCPRSPLALGARYEQDDSHCYRHPRDHRRLCGSQGP
ncbi:hypothetical protein MES4922_310017 [Mesorhizobium ventifaucium]|uniref:Uncharacterized protein n=1 Tax=Mesorhizobium ventifaucium TaxID=666020 RepID=A0ABN8JZZ6_9HYPH|nr:hypothetical protein MES4922_310017 [Mesorhizobium ventifaucium]